GPRLLRARSPPKSGQGNKLAGGSQPPGEPTLDWVLARRKSGQAARAGLRRQDVGEVEVAMEGTPQALIPKLQEPDDSEALRFTDGARSYRELGRAAAAVAELAAGARRIAGWAVPSVHTCVAVVGGLAAGTAVVPINPKAGERELKHIAADSEPDLLLAPPGV